MRRIGMRRATIKKIRDSLLMDAKDSTSNLQSMLISILEEGKGVEEDVTYIVPEDQREKVCVCVCVVITFRQKAIKEKVHYQLF